MDSDRQPRQPEKRSLLTVTLVLGTTVAAATCAMLPMLLALPACGLTCGSSCDSSNFDCRFESVSDCPLDRGCRREPACECGSVAECSSTACSLNNSEAACLQTGRCVWGERCVNEDIPCAEIADKDECERMVPCEAYDECG